MRILFIFLLFSMAAGQISSVSVGGGVRIALLDIAVVALLSGFTLTAKQRTEATKVFGQIFGMFVVVAIISLLWQVRKLPLSELLLSSLYLVRFTLYAEILVVVTLSDKLKNIALPALWSTGVVVGLLGLVQYFLYPNLRNLSYLGWDPHENRVFSTLLDPNFTGIILVLTLILGVWLLKNHNQTNTLLNFMVFLASGSTFLALLLTYSRGSFVSLFIVLIGWIAISRQWKKVLAGMILFLVILLFLSNRGGEGVNLLRSISVYARIKDSENALKMISRSPILGAGFNTLRFQKKETENILDTLNVSHSGAGFHNSWLFLIATTGMAGFAAYIWMWLNLLRTAKSRLLLFSFIAVAAHSLFDNSLFYPTVMLWMWVLAGVSIKKIPEK